MTRVIRTSASVNPDGRSSGEREHKFDCVADTKERLLEREGFTRRVKPLLEGGGSSNFIFYIYHKFSLFYKIYVIIIPHFSKK